MAHHPLIFTFLLPLLLIPSASRPAHSPDAVSKSFLDCLSQTPFPSSSVYTRRTPAFPAVLHDYIRNARLNQTATPKPQIILTPLLDSHVSAAVVCAKTTGINLLPRSGGHDYEGFSYVSGETPFAVLDLFNFRSVSVDIPTESAWVQAGATLGELYYAIWNATRSSAPYGFPGGICPTVGVGGHISGGGYGNLLRKYGLSVDNLLDAVVVDADGRIRDRKAMGEDFFWALSGGGAGSFGVLLSYRVRILRVPETVTVFRIQKTLDENADNVTGVVHDYLQMADKTVDELFIRMLVQPVKSKTKPKTKTIRTTFVSEFLGGADALVAVAGRDFPGIGVKKEDCREMTWIQSVLYWANFDFNAPVEILLNRTPKSVNFLKRKSDYLRSPISVPDLEGLWKKMIELGKPGLNFNPYGGKMGLVPPSATPIPHRAGNIAKIQHSMNWGDKDGGDAATGGFLKQARDLYDYTEPLMSKNPRRAFLNYRDSDIGTNRDGEASFEEGMVYGRKYFGENYERLVAVKNQVDPMNVFRNAQSIPATVPASGEKGRKLKSFF